MRAARVNDEKSTQCAVHQLSVLLQIFFVDTERIIGRIPLEDGRRFKQHTRQEETKERNEPCCKKSSHATPNRSAAAPLRDSVRRPDGRYTSCGCRSRSPDCRSADVLRGVGPGCRLSCARDELLLCRLVFSLRVFQCCFVRHPITLSRFSPNSLNVDPLSRTPRCSSCWHWSPRRQASSDLLFEFALTSKAELRPRQCLQPLILNFFTAPHAYSEGAISDSLESRFNQKQNGPSLAHSLVQSLL